MNVTTKKTTMATVKSFIKKNRPNLLINVKSSFDGMIDGLSYFKDGFEPVKEDKTESKSLDYYNSTQGIAGAWFVGRSRDYIKPFENSLMTGFDISNSCGHFILCIKK